ncbi:uncharacterized protein LOC110179125 [Drosophila serrata]|uniref:uncharacterized protein LOC110179125 n=1 Tax=Drosophila serrata TaxID=7274 RepID=UPI000A1D1E44|nr:uncharacterized protein LOC110179125 [Drosophila serrata]
MPRHRNNSARQAQQPEDDRNKGQMKKASIQLKTDDMATPDNEEMSTSNPDNLIQDNTDLQQPQTRQQQQQQMKLPNFMALKMDNFANYLGSVPTRIISPRSNSVDRKLQKSDIQQGSWNRVQSLDRDKRDESPTLTFLSPQSRRAENVGILYQRTDPYHQGYPDEAKHNDEPGEARSTDEIGVEYPTLGKDAECQIG